MGILYHIFQISTNYIKIIDDFKRFVYNMYTGLNKGEKMQTNMDLTIRKFFETVQDYTSKICALYTDKAAQSRLDKAKAQLSEIKQNIEKLSVMGDYDDEKHKLAYQTMGTSVNAGLFMKPNSNNNGAYLAFVHVVREIVDYYKQSSFGRNPDGVLKAIKSWNYQISTNLLKDFVYPFLPLSHFAVKNKVK